MERSVNAELRARRIVAHRARWLPHLAAPIGALGDARHMEFFCYHRDRAGSTRLRERMAEEHWSYMDRFAASMIARGPTFTADETLTGSVHILDLPDPAAARAFAFEEPCYRAGAYRDVPPNPPAPRLRFPREMS
jgi:uncharacterized protein YciI